MFACLAWLGANAGLAQDAHQNPASGALALTTGFQSPVTISVQAGGTELASNSTNGADDCAGFISTEPGVRVDYTRTGPVGLSFSAEADDDTSLVVRGPDGVWHCNDDTWDEHQEFVRSRNPTITLNDAQSGRYDIWVGNAVESEIGRGWLVPARLHIWNGAVGRTP
jgi:hypothetical protein